MSNHEVDILIVDDQKSNRLALELILSTAGHTTAMAESGEIALEIAERLNPKLILLDIVMSGMDGIETCRQLKKNTSTKDIPIIFVTAEISQKVEEAGLGAGGVDYISKPYKEGIILARVLTHLRLRAVQSELKRSNADFKEFAQIASHDLKAPLRQMRFCAEVVLEDEEGNLSSDSIEKLGLIETTGNRLSSLIDGLLEYAKVDAAPLTLKQVDLNKLVQEVLASLSHMVEEADAKVIVGSLPTINVEPNQTYQVFQNVVGNALKYRSEDIKTMVKIKSDVIEDHNGQQLCQITIKDNGIGFDDSQLDKVLSPFSRLVGKSEFEGSGLGLATTKKIVERHGGLLTAVSKEGRGSKFIISLPLK